jgi:hypothetical protein
LPELTLPLQPLASQLAGVPQLKTEDVVEVVLEEDEAEVGFVVVDADDLVEDEEVDLVVVDVERVVESTSGGIDRPRMACIADADCASFAPAGSTIAV